jgi:hypothetical protein
MTHKRKSPEIRSSPTEAAQQDSRILTISPVFRGVKRLVSRNEQCWIPTEQSENSWLEGRRKSLPLPEIDEHWELSKKAEVVPSFPQDSSYLSLPALSDSLNHLSAAQAHGYGSRLSNCTKQDLPLVSEDLYPRHFSVKVKPQNTLLQHLKIRGDFSNENKLLILPSKIGIQPLRY